MNKEVRQLLRQLKNQGCTIEHRHRGHIKVTLLNGNFVFISATPSDVRAVENIRKDLRKAGLDAEDHRT